MIKLNIPTWATVALSVVAGLLSLLNVTTFGLGVPWQQLVTIGLAGLAAIGIAPLTGPALQNVLHITHATALAVGGFLTTVVVWVTTLNIDLTLKGVLVGLLTLAAGVLFGPAGATPAPGPVAPRR